MTTDNKIPVLKNIVLAGNQPLIRENAANQQDQAGNSPQIPDIESPHRVGQEQARTTHSTTPTKPPGESQDKQEKELHTQAEILLGIMEEKLGIYLIRRRKKLLEALVEQLRRYRN